MKEMKLLWKENKNKLKSNFDVTKYIFWKLKAKLYKNGWLFNEYEKI